MTNNGYELWDKYYANFKRCVIILLIGFAGAFLAILDWYVLKIGVLIIIGTFAIIISVIGTFIFFIYGIYLMIRALFAKWPNEN